VVVEVVMDFNVVFPQLRIVFENIIESDGLSATVGLTVYGLAVMPVSVMTGCSMSLGVPSSELLHAQSAHSSMNE